MPAYPAVYKQMHTTSYYYSKSNALQKQLCTHDLPPEPNARGMWTLWGILWSCLFAIVPIAYIYIGLVVLRELYKFSPEFASLLHQYLPPLATLAELMHSSSVFVEAWCTLEALFYIAIKCYMKYLGSRDPLEASLRSAPFLQERERALLWQRIMDVEKDAAAFLTGWFFCDINKISRYDVREFITWSMFEGRNQEHLTRQELRQLEDFVQQLEFHISIHWYGTAAHSRIEGGIEQVLSLECHATTKTTRTTDTSLPTPTASYAMAQQEPALQKSKYRGTWYQ